MVLPVELSKSSLAEMQAERSQGVETEVFAYGRLPLTLSARCFTARAHNLPKDDCEYRCLDYPDGQMMKTQEDAPFLVINGIQTLSARSCNLLPELSEMQSLGVDILRISPQAHHTGRVVDVYARALKGEITSEQAAKELERWIPVGACDGYWHGRPGMDIVAARSQGAESGEAFV